MLDRTALLDSIATDCATIAAIARTDGDSAPIAHCGGWTVSGVVAHLGDVHRWATGIVTTGHPPEVDIDHVPDGELVAWFEAGAAALLRTLRDTDPESRCWTFGLPPGNAGFWTRRQALEAVVHRFDVESAVRPPSPIPTELAVMGIDEVANFLFDRQVGLERTAALDGLVSLEATDAGITLQLGASGAGTATISGRSEDLLLMLWRRPHGQLARSGDSGLLAAFDAAALTP
ncbi:MAG: maleylpyruvate isomerase family mycothiol-dependent enzyme [Acidimicrobiales bacterium]